MDGGTGLGRTVQSIAILDGRITAKGNISAGIGTEFGSAVKQGAKVSTESVIGAGIGSRRVSVSGRQSRVDRIQVRGANRTVNSLNSSGIGPPHAAWPAIWSIVRLIYQH
jgi:hypothetical protein